MLTNRQKGLIRALIYPVQFDQNPIESIDRVMRVTIQRNSLNAFTEEFSAAIATALKGDEQLSELVPKSPSEMVVREYLASIQTVMRRDAAKVTSGNVIPFVSRPDKNIETNDGQNGR